MVLIGLMGNKNCGKTTGAAFLIKNYGFVEKSFADPLKLACKNLFMLEDKQIYGTQVEKETPDPRWFYCTPRKILQYIGTDLLRDNLEKIMPGIGKNIFIHHFGLWYKEEIKKNPNLRIIVSDVRFQNEIDFIQSLGGSVIKINRNFQKLIFHHEVDIHQSEVEVKSIQNFDFAIDNNGTLDQYYDRLKEIIDRRLGIKKVSQIDKFIFKIKNAITITSN